MFLHILNAVFYTALAVVEFRDEPVGAGMIALILFGLLMAVRHLERPTGTATLLGLVCAGFAWMIWHWAVAAALVGVVIYLVGGNVYETFVKERLRSFLCTRLQQMRRW